MLYFSFYFALGLIAVLPFLFYAQRLPYHRVMSMLGLALVIAALIYVSFALVWADSAWLMVELLGVVLYGLLFVAAVAITPLLLAVAWLLHPLWDLVLHLYGPGAHLVPDWYAIACMSFDLAVALYIVWRVNQENSRTGDAA